MITIRAFRSVAPLVLAAAVGMLGAAVAQESPPAKKSNPAAKSGAAKSESAKSENGKSEPTAKGKSAAVPAPGGGQPSLLGQFGDWGAYTANSNGRTVCYALAKPASQATQPPTSRATRPIFLSRPVRRRMCATRSRS